MTPAVYTSLQHINDTRALLQTRLDEVAADPDFALDKLNEFAMSPTFYLVYQGLSDKSFLTTLHETYARGHPSLHAYPAPDTYSLPFFPPVHAHNNNPPPHPSGTSATSATEEVVVAAAGAGISTSVSEGGASQPLRVGFVSSHFRRHSICKLYCGIIQDLASATHTSRGNKTTSFQVYVFSGQDERREDRHTQQLRGAVHLFVRLARFTVPARQEVLKRDIDVLVYLDVGMDPSTTVWAASRLAPIQMCLWG